ncbi:MAG: M20 family metallopeptidase [Clostridia bacterium]|nr:M20 family metallopeptidase [Clostridia bacterium]
MVYEFANEISDELIKIRRYLHTIPELEFEEFETSKFIKSYLDRLGIKYESVLETGIAALIEGKRGKGKTILIRADIDALPLDEKNNIDYKSSNPGKMHACGHDAHITCLLGLCMILKKMNFDFCGNIKAVFQPAEEGSGGALPMIEQGVMKNPNVDAAIALHVEPLCSVGTLQYRNGAIMASPDDFKITIKGIGGHGACPDKCINPIYAVSELILKINNIVKDNFDDISKCIVSVCTVKGGSFNNIIPDSVEITGTARSLDNDTRTKIEALLLKYTKETSAANNCGYEFTFNKLYPPVINDKKMNNIVIESAKNIPEIKKIIELEKSSMTGDDFSYFAQLVPASYFKLGVGNDIIKNPLHSSEFNIDEKSLHLGAAVLTEAALKYLNG